MSAATTARPAPAFDIDAAVNKLLGLAGNLQAARTTPGGAGLFRISDFPEPSPQWTAAHDALGIFADELADIGGVRLMADVYDEAVERESYRAVSGVSAAWSGLHGWAH